MREGFKPVFGGLPLSYWLWRLWLSRGSIEEVEPRDVFALNLRERRVAAGLSQEALGAVSGMHFSEISRLERSKRDPRLGTIVKLARALNITTSELLVGVH